MRLNGGRPLFTMARQYNILRKYANRRYINSFRKKKITNSSKDTEDLNKVRDTLCYRTRRLNIMKMYIVPIFTILKFLKIYLFLIGG